MKRLKVAIITQFPKDPDQPVGGVEAVSVNLVRHLARDPGLDVHVLTFADPGPQTTAGTPAGSPFGNATLHVLPRPAGSMLILATRTGRRAVLGWLDAHPMDVVHAHDTYGLMVKGYRGRRVFTVHGFIYGDTAVSGTRLAGLRSLVWKRIETAGWADQPNIISISPYVRERVSMHSGARIHDIDNPVAEEFFDLAWQPEPTTVFSAAVISPRKNTHRLVEAAKCLRDRGTGIHLRLAGPIVDADYGERLVRYIESERLQDHVRLLGSLPSSRVREELERSAVFALVSLEENSPMGIEEAMAVGMPVVSSNRCGMPYMIRNGESGFLVDPHDPADIARALARILDDPARRDTMGACGRRIAEERFHPAIVARRTALLYREIA